MTLPMTEIEPTYKAKRTRAPRRTAALVLAERLRALSVDETHQMLAEIKRTSPRHLKMLSETIAEILADQAGA